jgi:hypothetical protein
MLQKNNLKNIVYEIHNKFDIAQDNLLKKSKKTLEKIIKSIKGIEIEKLKKQNLIEIEKLKKLSKVGFTSISKNDTYENKIKEYELLKKEMEYHIDFCRMVERYKSEYPVLKFLTLEKLDHLCDKYGLIYNPINKYIKDIPDKNLKEIEDTQLLKKEDQLLFDYYLIILNNKNKFLKGDIEAYYRAKLKGIGIINKNWITNKMLYERCFTFNILPFKTSNENDYFIIDEYNVKNLFIAAPKSYFNLSNIKTRKNKNNKKIFFVDYSIVFRWVKGGVQIITKWGKESLD